MGQGKLPEILGFSDTLYDPCADTMYEKLAHAFEMNFNVRYELGDDHLADKFFLKDYGYSKTERITTQYDESGHYYELFFDTVCLNTPEQFELSIYNTKAVSFGGYYHTQLWSYLIEGLKFPPVHKNNYPKFYPDLRTVNALLRDLMQKIEIPFFLIYGQYYNLLALKNIKLGEVQLDSFEGILEAAQQNGVQVFDIDEIINESESDTIKLNERFMDCPQEKIGFTLAQGVKSNPDYANP